MEKNIYQIKAVLKDFKPEIWRRLLISSDVELGNLHKILQTSMGWTNSHLHQFIKNRTYYEPPAPEDMIWDTNGIDYTDIQLNDLLKRPKEKIIYEYDFGDGWEHTITLEKIRSEDEGLTNPVCIDGARNSPPEDCGGVWGYAKLLEIIQDPAHQEYEMYTEWLPANFDPEYFDSAEINKTLERDDYGCIEFY